MKVTRVLLICGVNLILLGVSFSPSWSQSEKRMIPNTIEVIEKSWERRDGHMGVWVHYAIAEQIIFRPSEILSWLSTRKDIYNVFIQKLPHDVFTDYSGDGSDEKRLLEFRESLIKTLEGYKGVDETTKQLRLDLLKHLNSVTITIVD